MKKATSAEGVLGPLALATTVIGVLLGAIESVTKVADVVESHFYIAMFIFWCASLIFAAKYWPPKEWRYRIPSRRLLQIILTVIFFASIGWTYYEHHLRRTYPAQPPAFKLGTHNYRPGHSPFAVENVYADAKAANPLRLISFYLNEELSSFHETNEALFGAGKKYKTYSVDHNVYEAFQNGRCIGVTGEQPQRNVLPLLHKRLETTGQKELLPYVASVESFARLGRERGDIFEKVIFSPTELEALQKTSPGDYAIAKDWILNCVGVYRPVFTLVLKNAGSTSIDLVQVVYKVEEVGQVKGEGPSGPLFAEITYDHTIEHRVGDQSRKLNPVFHLGPGDSKALNLRILSNATEPGLGWLLRIAVVDGEGHTVITDRFQLYLNRERSVK